MIRGCPELSSDRGHYTRQGPEKGGYSLGSGPRVREVADIFSGWCLVRASVAVAEPQAEARGL